MNLKTMQDMQAQWQAARKELPEEVLKLRRDVLSLTDTSASSSAPWRPRGSTRPRGLTRWCDADGVIGPTRPRSAETRPAGSGRRGSITFRVASGKGNYRRQERHPQKSNVINATWR